ncbi:MAG: hypothetical protein R6X29_06415 [Acidimicrobiia bacterium]
MRLDFLEALFGAVKEDLGLSTMVDSNGSLGVPGGAASSRCSTGP